METRDFVIDDVHEISRLHEAMGLDYMLPNFRDGVVRIVELVTIREKVVAATAIKMQAESYLWLDPTLAPQDKWTAIRLCQRALMRECFRLGVTEMVAFIPDWLDKRFSKRLKILGWIPGRGNWVPWCREVGR